MKTSIRWQLIEEACRTCGVVLFDLEVRPEVLRVYIYKNAPQSINDLNSSEDGGKGITVDDCARVSHALTDHPQVEEILPGEMLLEVSSPGVNRKLTLAEHFAGAIGERVRVKFTPVGEPTRVVRGQVEEANDGVFLLRDEENNKTVQVSYHTVKEARVDFQF